MRFLRALVVCLSVGLLGLLAGGSRVSTQAAPPTVVLVVNAASPNPYGGYLAEILRAEGITDVQPVPLAGLTAASLTGVRLVVLAETGLTAAEGQVLADYVAGGGRLVAMRPEVTAAGFGVLAPALGLVSRGTTTGNPYVSIDPATATGAGFPATTLPVQGVADHYDVEAGASVVARLYADRTMPTGFPAVVRNGRTATWAYDVARSVVYTRQGNPANAGIDRFSPPLRTMDIFAGAIDLDRVPVPHADLQMRLLSRVITDLLADEVPLPRLWYFPGTARTLLVATGEANGGSATDFTGLLTRMEARGGRMTLYLSPGLTYPTATEVAAWRAAGHEIGLHPFGYRDGVSLSQGFLNVQSYFTQQAWAPWSATARNGYMEWQGWVDAAAVAAQRGMRLDTSFYTMGPAVTYGTYTSTGPNTPQARGYINGSGQPLRFVDTQGNLLPIYQQVTALVDEQLLYPAYSEQLTTAQALAVSRQLIDDSEAGGYAAIATQFHVEWASFGQIQPWIEGTLDHAVLRGAPIWPAERWLTYTEARHATRVSQLAWSDAAGELTFQAEVPAGAEAQSVLVPLTYVNRTLSAVTIDGAAVSFTTQAIHGRPTAFVAVEPGAGGAARSVVAVYAAASNGVPVSVDDTATTAGGAVTVAVLANDSDPDGDTLRVTGVGAPTRGTAAVDANQTTVTYTPNAGLCGTDAFTYTVSDGRGGTATATVNVRVACTLALGPASGPEGNAGSAALTFTATLAAASNEPVSATWTTGDGTATAGADYQAASGTVAFAPGVVAQPIAVTVLGDTVDEADETVVVTLTAPVNAVLGAATGVGTIVDDDGAPTLTVSDVSLTEGNSGNPTMTFVVTLAGASGATATVQWATADGTATAPADYLADAGTLTFAPGLATQNIVISLVGDTLDEPNETFQVTLANAVNATISDGTGVGTIVSDDGAAAGPTLAIADTTVTEGTGTGGTAQFTVTLANPGIGSGGSIVHNLAGEFLACSTAPTSVVVSNAGGGELRLPATLEDYFDGNPIDSTRWLTGYAKPWYTTQPARSVNGILTLEGTYLRSTASFLQPRRFFEARALLRPTGLDTGWTDLGFVREGEIFPDGGMEPGFPKPPDTAARLFISNDRNELLAWGRDGTDANPLIELNFGAVDLQYRLLRLEWTPTETRFYIDGTLVGNMTPSPVTLRSWAWLYSLYDTRGLNVDWVRAGVHAASGTFQSCALDAGTVTTWTAVASEASVPAGTSALVLTRTSLDGATWSEWALTAGDTITSPPGRFLQYRVDLATTDEIVTPEVRQVAVSYGAGSTVSVRYTTVDGTATGASDYVGGTGTLSFPPGTTTQTLAIPVVGDAVSEGTEAFSVVLDNPLGATITDATGTGTIVDDDNLPTVSVAAPGPVTEGNAGQAPAVFTVALSAPSGLPVTMTYATVDGTAIAPGDYIATTGTLTIPAGETGGTIAVPVLGDSVDEADETFTLTLSNAAGATLATATATATIADDDPLPTLSINDVTLTEGNSGSANATFTVTLSAPSSRIVNVAYATAPGSATAGQDYTTVGNTLSFPAGTTTRTLNVPVLGDTLDEDGETFTVVLSNAVNADIADGTGVGTINDNDGPTIAISDAAVTEAAGASAVFSVTLSAPSVQTVTVNFATAQGTATAGSDYTTTTGTVSFAPGTTTQTIIVPLVDNAVNEADETFTVTLSGAVNAGIADASGLATIADDDPLPTLSINDVAVTEGNTGNVNMTFTVTLSPASGRTVTVAYATADVAGGATASVDYNAASNTLTFSAGTTSRTFTVTVRPDTVPEANEAFAVNLTNPVNATLARSQGTGTIRDNDGAVTVTSPNTAVNWAAGSTQRVTWNHSVGAGSTMTIELSRDGGTTWEPVTNAAVNAAATTGAFDWLVSGPATTAGRIRVTWNTNGRVTDISNANFTISAAPTITVGSPSSTSTNWGYGTDQAVSWTTTLGAGDTVNVLMSTDGGATFPIVLASGIPATPASTVVRVPTLAAATTTARIRVEWTANTSIRGTNPANFRVQAPFVTVTNPNTTTATWTIGTNATIQWSQNLGARESVQLELSRDGGATYEVILASTPSDGSQSVAVQAGWATTQGRVRITWLDNGAVSDISNNNFRIQ
jgi:hypothetical protein